MNQTLTSIFETQGPQSLNISNQSFSQDNIFEEFIDSSFFHQVNFINCSFEGCELLGINFNFLVEFHLKKLCDYLDNYFRY